VILGLHFGAEGFVHFEAVAVVEVGRLDESAGVLGIGPEEDAGGAAVPEAPMDFELLGIT
jgi:hypothetical protein